MNICAIYWQRLGNLPYKLALQKVCGGNASALQSLCDHDVIKLIDDHLCIDFLNEQLAEFENTSKVNSENARSGWEKRRNKATVKRPHSDPNAIRGEERREDEREKENYPHAKDAFNDITKNYLETEPQRNILKNKGWASATEKDVNALLFHFLELQVDISLKTKKDVKSHFRNWLNSKDAAQLQILANKIHERQQSIKIH